MSETEKKKLPFDDDPLFTVSEIAETFKVGEATVRLWMKNGLICALKLPNGSIRIRHSEIVRFAKTQYGNGSNKK